jgi:general secretion pathway protein G
VRKGFTLIEVLLVVGILALLAAFVVPSLMRSGDQAKEDLARAAVGRTGPIANAIQKFRFDTGQYPEELADLTSREVPEYLEIDEDKWKGPYIEDVNSLKDPWENEYQYVTPGEINEDSYDLWSNGKDGEEGTEDDLTNWTEEDY